MSASRYFSLLTDATTPIREYQARADINAYLPTELLREIFLYCIEVDQIKFGQLAPVCRHWRSVITTITSLWSTLRVGTWTETERVAIWLQRAYPKKVVIDTERDRKGRYGDLALAALQSALTSTDQWHELTISSLPPENLIIQLGIQAASPMNVLKVLHVAAGCVQSPSLAHLLNLVPTEAPLCELRLHSPFASTHFLQSRWFPILKNLTVLIIGGRAIDEPFELLPTFTKLQIFEADRLHLPFYGPNTNLPLLCTLRRLHLRACSIQWMAGRQFPCLEECTILLPRHWEEIQQHEAHLPSCRKFTYHGHPMITARYFRVPEMTAMELKSHDSNEPRVRQHLRQLCRVDGRISKLTVLHLTLQCSEQVLIKVLKYLVPLQELVLSIARPSPSWQNFLESLAANPSTNEWPVCDPWASDYQNHRRWEAWCSSQTWHANVLPHLKSLGIQCPEGFSQSECIDNFPLFRFIGWTRSHLTPCLEHLKVWEGRGSTDDIAVDYISTGYLDEHPGISHTLEDLTIVRGMVTRHLVMSLFTNPLLQLHSTSLFKRLQHLVLLWRGIHEISVLPYLEQIKRLEIRYGIIPVYPLNLDLPLTRTLQWLKLQFTTFPWMLGRTFKALRDFQMYGVQFPPENRSGYEGLLVDLPTCTTLKLTSCSPDVLRLRSRSNIQILRWGAIKSMDQAREITTSLTAINSLQPFPLLPSVSTVSHANFAGVPSNQTTSLVNGSMHESPILGNPYTVDITISEGIRLQHAAPPQINAWPSVPNGTHPMPLVEVEMSKEPDPSIPRLPPIPPSNIFASLATSHSTFRPTSPSVSKAGPVPDVPSACRPTEGHKGVFRSLNREVDSNPAVAAGCQHKAPLVR